MGGFCGDLTVSKLFYFFFFGAFGSLFPLLSLYFKQLGMNASHVGLLVGVRPFVEFISAPLWGGLADRFRKGREVLIFSVCCWIIFTIAIVFVRPSTSFCLLVYNRTEYVLEAPGITTESGRKLFVKTRLNVEAAPGLAPEVLHEQHNISGYNKTQHDGLVKPPASSRVYRRNDVEKIFAILLVLVTVGDFFCAPAITIADACTLHYLGDAPERYGRQRMYGSVGWALSMFLIGIALDYGAFSSDECGQTDIHEKDYTICFVSFGALMTIAVIIATKFRFIYDHEEPCDSVVDVQNLSAKDKSSAEGGDKIQNEKERTDSSSDPAETAGILARPKSDSISERSKWITVLKRFSTLHYLSFLFVMWWFGFGVGLIFCFLFWHLQDLGGSPSIFGITSVVNHSSEIVAYFFTTDLIKAIGHIKVLYVGLLANVARFLYVSVLKDPWFILPFEVMQGISHASVWAAATAYIAAATPPLYRSSAQGILQGVHYGLGRACGALLGGIAITYVGTEFVFRAYGISCAVILVIFFAINRLLDAEVTEIPTGVAKETDQGVRGAISMDTLYPPTEGSLTNAANMGSDYGSTHPR